MKFSDDANLSFSSTDRRIFLECECIEISQNECKMREIRSNFTMRDTYIIYMHEKKDTYCANCVRTGVVSFVVVIVLYFYRGHKWMTVENFFSSHDQSRDIILYIYVHRSGNVKLYHWTNELLERHLYTLLTNSALISIDLRLGLRTVKYTLGRSM